MISFLSNYPFTLIEATLFYYMVFRVLPCKYNGVKRLSFIITAILFYSFAVYFCPVNSFFYRIILFYIISVAIISFLFEGNFYIKSFYILLNYYILLTSDLMAGNAVSYINRTDINIVLFTSDTTIITSIISKMINIILFLISIHYFRKLKYDISKKYWVTMDFILTLFIVTLIFIMYINASLQNISNIYSLYLFGISISFFALGFLVIYFFQEICYFYEKDKQNSIANIKAKFLEQQMAHQKIEAHELRIIRHDIKNNLALISNLLKRNNLEESKKYIDAITVALDETKPAVNSGNIIIDSVLNYKIAVCKKIDIKTQINVDNLPEININPLDLSAIISNVLDNAIEANEKIEQLERFISIKIFCYKNFLSIVVKNPFKNNIEYDNDLVKTSKPDKMFHGYGLQSIKLAAEKNYGSFKFYIDNDIFTATILLPIELNIQE
ncbi:Sensor histidine kinase YesM [Sporobacter termitidis DSM 10068]|uniref:Sensor histidine kinase YesM n=1 Tax=Sporobacter termitidis DSM 10068 TaxID=1123282 RepID=A0A1M5W480_9FIRM|nr:sensor histidine kinase [Sporobacter termitidis]SHH82389.1 Sensor histidine kinase YesM [Sporobacter termitidis DSM 10068]